MLRILFFIHDLGHGGAEKVLVNLVNHLDPDKFDITVLTLFGGGVNEQFLAPHIRHRAVFRRTFRGNTHLMKLLPPRILHRLFVKEHADIEIAYLEGPSARIISGCEDPSVKRINWIHCTQQSRTEFARSFRSYHEAEACYRRFSHTVFVSQDVRDSFCRFYPTIPSCSVLYNTLDSNAITEKSDEPAPEISCDGKFRLIAVGTLNEAKGYLRLLRIVHRLCTEGYGIHLYVLGEGPLKKRIEQLLLQYGLSDSVTLLGYRTNPYKYVAKCDLFVCASYAEGFSTAATEALIVGTPVITTLVAGMKEMLGKNNEYGIITDNDEQALYSGIKQILDHPDLLAHYKEMAKERGKRFHTETTVHAVEELLLQP